MGQDGSLYAIGDACYLKYYNISDGKRVHKTIQLCKKSDVYSWWKKKGKWGFSSAVRELQRETMNRVKADAKAKAAAVDSLKPQLSEMRVTDFWERVYLPYCEAVVPLTGQPRMKPSTVRGFKQIWRQHLKGHFGDLLLTGYEPATGNRFLRTLTGSQGKNTLKHLKSLASAIFSHAVDEEILKLNPWREVKIPKDAIDSAATMHYTLAEVEDIISALVDHVDCQLVMALACFLGLRPGEIAALRWDDFDDDIVHIRRSVVRGVVGTPKTPESIASLPLPAQVKIPLELWRRKVESNGYVFESKNGTPVDLHNLTSRVIVPHVDGSRKCVVCDKIPKRLETTRWKTLYAGRRCAATSIIELNGGNLSIGQALLRHKSQSTTALFYKKAITPATLAAGMKLLELGAGGPK